MKVNLKIAQNYDVKYLKCRIGARYWEDSFVNGDEDTEGKLIPLRDGDDWCPVVDVESGIILDWPVGTTAEIHYKSVDDNDFALLDQNKKEITSIEGYVIKMMSPKENGYGDYVIMDIDENGKIQNWKPSFGDFINSDD